MESSPKSYLWNFTSFMALQLGSYFLLFSNLSGCICQETLGYAAVTNATPSKFTGIKQQRFISHTMYPSTWIWSSDPLYDSNSLTQGPGWWLNHHPEHCCSLQQSQRFKQNLYCFKSSINTLKRHTLLPLTLYWPNPLIWPLLSSPWLACRNLPQSEALAIGDQEQS